MDLATVPSRGASRAFTQVWQGDGGAGHQVERLDREIGGVAR